jgi:hypothetical protein
LFAATTHADLGPCDVVADTGGIDRSLIGIMWVIVVKPIRWI